MPSSELVPCTGSKGKYCLKEFQSPVPAFVAGRGYGLVYTSDSSFVADYQVLPLFGKVHWTFKPQNFHVTSEQVIFFSVESILLQASKSEDASWSPVEIVRLEEVTFYDPDPEASSATAHDVMAAAAAANTLLPGTASVSVGDTAHVYDCNAVVTAGSPSPLASDCSRDLRMVSQEDDISSPLHHCLHDYLRLTPDTAHSSPSRSGCSEDSPSSTASLVSTNTTISFPAATGNLHALKVRSRSVKLCCWWRKSGINHPALIYAFFIS